MLKVGCNRGHSKVISNSHNTFLLQQLPTRVNNRLLGAIRLSRVFPFPLWSSQLSTVTRSVPVERNNICLPRCCLNRCRLVSSCFRYPITIHSVELRLTEYRFLLNLVSRLVIINTSRAYCRTFPVVFLEGILFSVRLYLRKYLSSPK